MAKIGSSQRGFTLVELMVVVAIVAILAGIAYPIYTEQVARGRRADAQSGLFELAQFMERYYTTNNSYTTGGDGDGPPALPFTQTPKTGAAKYYNLSVRNAAANDLLQDYYIVQAAPSGAQTGDRCGTMTLDSRGVKGASETDCWRR